jgi:hypothetical protein
LMVTVLEECDLVFKKEDGNGRLIHQQIWMLLCIKLSFWCVIIKSNLQIHEKIHLHLL